MFIIFFLLRLYISFLLLTLTAIINDRRGADANAVALIPNTSKVLLVVYGCGCFDSEFYSTEQTMKLFMRVK